MASTEPAYPKWRRRTFVLYRFQSNYALAVVGLSMFITGMTALVIYRLFKGSGGIESPLDILESNGVLDARALWLLVGVFVLMICSFAFFYLIVIVATHRVAGPLAVMSRHLSALSQGKYPVIRDLRENDELKEFFSQFRNAVDRMRAQGAAEAKVLQDALEAITGSGPRTPQAVGALRTLLDMKLQALGQGQAPIPPPAEQAPLPTGTGER